MQLFAVYATKPAPLQHRALILAAVGFVVAVAEVDVGLQMQVQILEVQIVSVVGSVGRDEMRVREELLGDDIDVAVEMTLLRACMKILALMVL